jgi:hypothetical protein
MMEYGHSYNQLNDALLVAAMMRCLASMIIRAMTGDPKKLMADEIVSSSAAVTKYDFDVSMSLMWWCCGGVKSC